MSSKAGSLGKDAITLTASKIIANVLTMLTAMLLARVRTLEENGTYSQLLLVINLVTSILMLGLPNSINFFLAKANTEEEKNRFLSVYYTLSTLLSAVVGITLACLMPCWETYFSNPQIAEFGFFLLIYPWTRIICSSADNVLVVLKKTKVLMLYRLFNSIAVLASILFIWLCNLDFRTYMVLYVTVEAAFALFVYRLAAHYTGKIRFHIDRDLIRRIFEFSIPIGLAGIIGTLNIELDKLMIGRMFSTEELAVYTYASKEMPVTLIASSITAVLMPRMVRLFEQNKNREAIEMWKNATTLSVAILAFFAVGLATFSREAITFLYSEKYVSGHMVFSVYSLCLLTKCTYFGMVLNAKGATKSILYCSIGTLALNVMLNLFFYRMFGMIGPALATLIAALSMQLLQLLLSSRLLEVRFCEIFPWKSSVQFLMLNGMFSAASVFVLKLVQRSVAVAILCAVLWGITYFCAIGKRALSYWNQMNSTK